MDVLYKDPKKAKYEIIKRFKGTELKGKRYTPLFPYFSDRKNSFVMANDKYVTDESGTGIVHQAPAFGEDDYRVCLAHGVISKDEIIPCPVDESGIFTAEVSDFTGQYVKASVSQLTLTLIMLFRMLTRQSSNCSRTASV